MSKERFWEKQTTGNCSLLLPTKPNSPRDVAFLPLINQTYPHIQIVMVGDGCIYKTSELVAQIGIFRLEVFYFAERGRYIDNLKHRWLVASTKAINQVLILARGVFYFVTE